VRIVAVAIAALLVLGALVGLLTRRDAARSPAHAKSRGTDSSTLTTLAAGPSLPASLAQFMGLTVLRPTAAPAFALVDQDGRRLALSELRGKVVLLTFFDAHCTGVCPVEARELLAAETLLEARSVAAKVVILAVNVDPGHTSVADAARLARSTGLARIRTFHALTGPVAVLRSVWAAYGVQVELDEVKRVVLYSPLLVFVGPTGRERYLATPYANELADGRSVLPRTEIARWGDGIADFALRLLPAK
jgi:cytochrome oxidase Cu insertion factor (SCO1/SenC/PrrC family)